MLLGDLGLEFADLAFLSEDSLLLMVNLPFPFSLNTAHFDVFLAELLFEGEELILKLLILVFHQSNVLALRLPLILKISLCLLDNVHFFLHLIVKVVLEKAK